MQAMFQAQAHSRMHCASIVVLFAADLLHPGIVLLTLFCFAAIPLRFITLTPLP